MTDEEIKELVAGLAVQLEASRAEHDRLLLQLVEEGRRTQQQQQKLQEATGQQFKELGQQIGGLGRKFGGFTEGMAFPSMDRILRERFGMDVVGMRLKSQLNGKWMELDVMAYSTVTDDVYIVEVKSYLKEGAIEQMLKKMEQFSTFYPAQRGKKLYGILAAVDVDNEAVRQALSEGFYMARINNETFELVTPQDFEPRAFDC